MVNSMLVQIVVDLTGVQGRGKPKTVNPVFVAALLSMHHSEKRAKTDWLEIRIMTDCCISELAI